MKLYLLFLLTALLNFYTIMLLWGVSAGFANYLPIASVVSSILLFIVAAPMIVFNSKWGLIVGFVFSITMLPFSTVYIISTVSDKNYHNIISMLFEIPFLLPFWIFVFAGKRIFKKNYLLRFPIALIPKIVLCSSPILLFIAYAISVSKYISFTK